MEDHVIPAANAEFLYSGFQQMNVSGGRVGFQRTIVSDKKYHFDTPGIRMAFRCNAEKIGIDLLFRDRAVPHRMQNGIGIWRIDGKTNPRWKFERGKRDSVKNEPVKVDLPANGEMHNYELFLPYGEICEIHSVKVNAGTVFEAPPPPPAFRAVFYGDSITQGFCASRIDLTFPFLTGMLLDYDVVNLGIAGIGLNPGAAKILGSMEMHLLIMEIGANDWMNEMHPDDFRKNVRKFLHDIRIAKPGLPIRWITPLWISPKWKGKTPRYELDLYRKIIEEEVSALNDPAIRSINGLELLDADPDLFDEIPVHPADSGHEQIAERLAEHLIGI